VIKHETTESSFMTDDRLTSQSTLRGADIMPLTRLCTGMLSMKTNPGIGGANHGSRCPKFTSNLPHQAHTTVILIQV